MALYTASSLIDKTMILDRSCNIYHVIDINNFGDKAKPAFIAPKGFYFIIDSFLDRTEGYTSSYGIGYAKRTVPYFTFFDAGHNYMGIAIVGDGRFSIKGLQDQGVLSVQEQAAKDARESRSALENFFADLAGPVKFLLIAGAAALLFLGLPKNRN